MMVKGNTFLNNNPDLTTSGEDNDQMHREIFSKCVYFRPSLRTLKKKISKYDDIVDIDALWKKKCAGHVEFVNNPKYEREMFLSSLAQCDMY